MSIKELWPLSPLQEGIFFHSHSDSVDHYLLWVQLRSKGTVDVERFGTALATVLTRHPNLRAGFVISKSGTPVQVIPDSEKPEINVIDLDTDRDALAKLEWQRTEPFDLGKPPLLRCAILRKENGPDEISLVVHHILIDGWSLPLLLAEIEQVYRDAPETEIAESDTYRRYVLDTSRRDIEESVRAWTITLEGITSPCIVATGDGDGDGDAAVSSLSWSHSEKTSNALTGVIREHGSTLSTFLRLVWGTVVGIIASTDDVVFGATVSGRDGADDTESIGLFINAVPVRVRRRAGDSPAQTLSALAADHIATIDDHHVPIIEIQRALGLPSLFDSLLVVENYPDDSETDREFELTAARDGTHYPLALVASFDGGLQFRLDYNPGAVAPSLAAKIPDLIRTVIDALCADMQTSWANRTSLPRSEAALLRSWSFGRTVPIEGPPTLVDCLEDSFRTFPDEVAISAPTRSHTYRELDHASGVLAARLAEAGVSAEVPVTCLVPRSAESVVTKVAIIRAGGVFAPLHADDATERLASIADEIDSPVVLATYEMRETEHLRAVQRSSDVILVSLPELLEAQPTDVPRTDVVAESLACILYTSGSTGRPKGVALTHAALVERCHESTWHESSPPSTLMHSPDSFDPSLFEVWCPLLSGGHIVVARPGPLDCDAVQEAVRRGRPKSALIISGLFRVLAADRPDCFRGMREIITGGDIVSPESVTAVLDHCDSLVVRTVYGPTESTVCATQWSMPDHHAVADTVPLGAPVDNARVTVLDQWLNPVPIGATGEIYIAGTGVARGYLGRPDLTASRFVPAVDDEAGEVMYRTGDLGRWNDDGLLEFLGRADDQAKVNGFRVEVGEIETAIASIPWVSDSTVIIDRPENRTARIIAYVVPCDTTTEAAPPPTELPATIRPLLADTLPHYMIPAEIIELDELPINRNGKIDKRALPRSVSKDEHAIDDRFLGSLLSIYAEALGIPMLGPSDDFYSLGGHSLAAMKISARVRSELDIDATAREVLQAHSAGELAEILAEKSASSRPKLLHVSPDSRPPFPPLSRSQRRLWFVDLLSGPSSAYNVPLILTFSGVPDTTALGGAISDLVDRHAVLRTVIDTEEGVAWQRVLDFGVPLEVIETSDDSEYDELVKQAAKHQFDLSTPPFRATLLVRSPQASTLVLCTHHIAIDGWSLAPAMRDLEAFYEARLHRTRPRLPGLDVDYVDYSLWQEEIENQLTRGGANAYARASLDFWKRTLAHPPETLHLADRDPSTQDPGGAPSGSHSVRISTSSVRSLRNRARQRHVTLFVLVHAALLAAMTRRGAGDDLLIGTNVAGRGDRALDEMVGCFINPLALRVDLEGISTIGELLEVVHNRDLEAFANQELPFDLIVEKLAPTRVGAQSPFFSTVLMVQDETVPTPEFTGLNTIVQPYDAEVSKFSLVVTADTGDGEDGDGLGLVLDYDKNVYDDSTIRALTDEIVNVLVALGDPGSLDTAVRTETPPIRERSTPRSLCSVFRERAQANPPAIAVTCGDTSLSYGQLDDGALALAGRLHESGVNAGDFVAIRMERSEFLPMAILGVLYAGAAYVPLDPAAPDTRNAYILDSAKASVMVVDSGADLEFEDSITRIPVTGPAGEDVDPTRVEPGSLAYVIFTSGSTGRPKGVPVTHGHVLRLFEQTDQWFGFGPADVWTLFHSYAFDFSVWELWGALLHGGRLVIVDSDVSRSPDEFLSLVIEEKVTVLNQTPTAFGQLVAADERAREAGQDTDSELSLRVVIFGGERLSTSSLAPWGESHGRTPTLVNMYGITETTVHVTYTEITEHVSGEESVIGEPIPDLDVHILNGEMEPVAPGEVGEMYVSGAGVAGRYLDRPALSSVRFVADPFSADGAVMYRTGDLASTGDEGLIYHGRADRQVKIRGHRVELGEIESALAKATGASSNVVTIRPLAAGDSVVGYFTTDGSVSDTAAIRKTLAELLPSYMCPDHLVSIDRLPTTVNGKLDIEALPEPKTFGAGREAGVDETVSTIATLFEELLGVENVGADDDFFSLGGHSLLATTLVSRIRSATGHSITIRALFDNPTPTAIAATLQPATPSRPKLERRTEVD